MIVITLETFGTAAKSDGRSDSSNLSNSLFHFLYKPAYASSLGGWFLTFRRTWPLRIKAVCSDETSGMSRIVQRHSDKPRKAGVRCRIPLSNHQGPQSSVTDCVYSASHSRRFSRKNCNRAASIANRIIIFLFQVPRTGFLSFSIRN